VDGWIPRRGRVRRFRQEADTRRIGRRDHLSYLSVAGGDDDLSPIEHTYKLHDEIKSPNTLVVYRGELHGVTDNMDVRAFIADWMKDRFAGKPLTS
jgi:hypothetical protein